MNKLKKPIRGYCTKKRKFYGMAMVSDKGQVAIPVDLRRDLGIKKGDELVVVKRDDGKGFNMFKSQVVGKFLERLAKD